MVIVAASPASTAAIALREYRLIVETSHLEVRQKDKPMRDECLDTHPASVRAEEE
jgi:hypothetical protein